ncbi:MAG TPA: quinone oxidoreductase, partial [Polyangiaceae bacterium]|nr:quinone oxidoreductase [Polyangiaceae bacterium]
MARAIRIHRPGGPDVLTLEDVDPGQPGAGEVLVKHTAIGVNFVDTYQRSGLYPVKLPSGLGSEAAGVVESVGPDVSDLRPGDRVAYASAGLGGYSDARVVAADRLLKLPEGVSDETAATILLKGMTSEYLIRRTYPVKHGDTVLFHAAAGGVGSIACRWLKALGARVIGTTGSDAKAALARENGCDEVIVYTREDFVARTRDLTNGRGVDVVYDSVGKDTLLKSLDCLVTRGLLVSFGNASGKPDPLELLLLSQKGSLYVTRPNLAHYVQKREELEACAAALFSAYEAGHVPVVVGQRFPLERAADAHRALESR